MYFTPKVGKDFDALFIDPDAEDTPFDCFECDTLEVYFLQIILVPVFISDGVS